jgi:hypothetical protein
MEMQMVDTNCWIAVFDVTKYDADDPHAKLRAPKSTPLRRISVVGTGNNDIQNVIMESGATVLAYKGTEIAFAPGRRIS